MTDHGTATVEASLRLGNGFTRDERERIVDGWSSLDAKSRTEPRNNRSLRTTDAPDRPRSCRS